jgi:predicted RNA-binding protein with PUA-like domain
MSPAPRYFLLKSEPGVYSIDDLQRDGTTLWEGVRNYQARNIMRDEMRVGDLAFFYHSNATPPAIVGVVQVSAPCAPDPSQFDPRGTYFDPKSKQQSPSWLAVEVRFVEKFVQPIALQELRDAEALQGMALLAKGQRLSVQRVGVEHWTTICQMAERARALTGARR